MSNLEGLLIFAGIPLLMVVVITVMVMASSLAKGNQPRTGRGWQAEPEWFGAPRAVGAAEAMANPHQIESGPGHGYDPALAGDHDNVTSDDRGTAGDRGLPTDPDIADEGAGAIRSSGPDTSDDHNTGGASVRW